MARRIEFQSCGYWRGQIQCELVPSNDHIIDLNCVKSQLGIVTWNNRVTISNACVDMSQVVSQEPQLNLIPVHEQSVYWIAILVSNLESQVQASAA